jgi:hypothetical protein
MTNFYCTLAITLILLLVQSKYADSEGFGFEDTDSDFQTGLHSPNITLLLIAKKYSDMEQLFAPNCMDLAFMQTDGLRACNANSVTLEVTEVSIAIANCYLKNQIKHLAKEEIRCMPGDSACLGSLKDYQRRILMNVSSQLGLYCSVHLMRRQKHKVASWLKECSQIAVIIQETLQQTHEAVLKQQKKCIKVLQELSAQPEKQTQQEMKAVQQEIKQLEKEVQTMEADTTASEDAQEMSKIEFIASKLDFFVYFLVFCMQVLIILILTVLLPNASDVPMYQALVSILIGSVAKVAIFLLQDATNFFATIVPISYFQVLQLAVFFYFAILRYLSMFIRTIPQQQKALLINQNYDAVKNLTKKVTTPEWDQEITPFAAHGDFKDVRLVFEPSTPQISPSRQTFLPQSHLVRHSENVDENLQPKTKRRILLRRPDTGSKLKSTVPSEGDEPMRFYTQRPPIQLRYTAKKILF